MYDIEKPLNDTENEDETLEEIFGRYRRRVCCLTLFNFENDLDTNRR